MSGRPRPKLSLYGALSVAPLVFGFVFHRPEVVVLALPFAVALSFGVLAVSRPGLEVKIHLEADRVIEGDELTATLVVSASDMAGRVELATAMGAGLVPTEDRVRAVLVANDEEVLLTYHLRAIRWGAWALGPIAWRALDPGRFVDHEGVLDDGVVVRVHPSPERLARLLAPAQTSLVSGNYRARQSGAGIEFSSIRPYEFGDSFKDVNWHLSSQHDALFVNTRHAERSGDVVVLVDTFSERHLASVVRAAVSVVTAYAGARDRIGVVSFGGVLGWVEPGLGTRQLYRILDALLSTRTVFSYAWRDALVIPPRALPPGALVVAISPLEDDRTVATLTDLRGRGIDLVVLQVRVDEEEEEVGPLRADELAHRIYAMQKSLTRDALTRAGVAAASFGEDVPVSLALVRVGELRRRAPAGGSLGRRS